MKKQLNSQFGGHFKQLRLTSGIATLKELGDLFADHGLIYESSFLSHVQAGRKVPRNRQFYMTFLAICKARHPHLTIDACNTLLQCAQQGALSNIEQSQLGFGNTQSDVLIAGKHPVVRGSWYMRMAEDYIIMFKNYIADDTAFFTRIHESHDILYDLLENCISHEFIEETLGLWEIVKKYLWEQGDWGTYSRFVDRISKLLDAHEFVDEWLYIQVDDVSEIMLKQKQFLTAYKLLKSLETQVLRGEQRALKGRFYHRLGVIFFCRKQWEKAYRSFARSRQYFESAGVMRGACRSALNSAIALESLKRADEAKQCCISYMHIVEKHGFHELSSSLNYHLHEPYNAEKNYRKSEYHLRHSNERESLLADKAGHNWRKHSPKTKMRVCVDSYLK